MITGIFYRDVEPDFEPLLISKSHNDNNIVTIIIVNDEDEDKLLKLSPDEVIK